MKLTACYTGSICLHPSHSCPSLCLPCSASHSRTSLILQTLKQREEGSAARRRQKKGPFSRGVRYCGARSVLIHVTEEYWSYLAPRCICTGSLSSCTLHCSSDPLERKRYTVRTPRCWFSWIRAFCDVSLGHIPGLPGRGNRLVYADLVGTKKVTESRLPLTHAHHSPHAKSDEMQEHLSRVSGAGLCDITVVHSVAAAVTSWIKLASKTERLAFYTDVSCGVKRPNSYQTCGIAARTVAAVRAVGEGALLAAFLIALLKTNSREALSI